MGIVPSIFRRPLRHMGCALLALLAADAGAACIASSDPAIREYERRIGYDPESVVADVTTRLTDKSLTAGDQAALYGVLSEAEASLERYTEAREAADRGMALINDPRSPVYVNLLHYGASNSIEEEVRPRAFEQTKAALAMQQMGSAEEACLLIALGILEHLAGKTDEASIQLTRAHRISAGPDRELQRINAAEVLSMVLRDLRDPQALAINQEVLAWYEKNAPFRVSSARFMRGAILRQMGNHTAALNEFRISRQLGVETRDSMGIAYADLLMCLSNIDLRELIAARGQCESALGTFSHERAADTMKRALTGLAEIDLLEHQPAAALKRLNRVLDQQGRDVVPVRLLRIYELRAQANSELGNAAAALADYQAYMERFKASKDAENARQASALRARFETDREIERNTFLQRELQNQNERLDAQSARIRWMILSGVISTVLIALLTYLLFSTRRKRVLLAKLAQQDDLTGLPNRRRTLQIATEAFELARLRRQPLTIGILDLDHFKQVNDRFGHATGDMVLREFARIGRDLIRTGDALGRWGGEEFLIVLPDTTLDVALGIVDRIRKAAARIGGVPELKISLSAGLATNESNPGRPEDIIASADAALYDAKKGGRDLVRIAQDSYDVASTGIRRGLRDAGVELITGGHRSRR